MKRHVVYDWRFRAWRQNFDSGRHIWWAYVAGNWRRYGPPSARARAELRI